MLESLVAGGLTLAVATSKPAVFAREVVEHLGLGHLLAGVFGPAVDGPSSKAEVIAATCEGLGLSPTTTVMVGDRAHDVLGAAANAMRAFGVLWGHGSRAELEAAGALALVATPGELEPLLLGGGLRREASGTARPG